MTPQLELHLSDRERPARRLGLRAIPGVLLRWAPAWLPIVLFAQLAWYGLRPAWAEREHLDRAEAELSQREQHLAEEHVMLVRDRRKLSDPIYRERVRRSQLDLRREPLTLENTRSGDS